MTTILTQGVGEIQPKLIISFSERVLQQLGKKYKQSSLKMKDCFGELLSLDINGYRVPYIPVVHLPKVNSLVEKHYFPMQTEKLEKLRDKLDL